MFPNTDEFKRPDNRLNVSPVSSANGMGEANPYISGAQFQYMPLFMKAAIQAGYIKDDSQLNSETHVYNAGLRVPVGQSGVAASYGVQGYDSRYSSPEYSQSYRGMSPSVGLDYTNGNWNAYVQKTQGQSPFFGINYFNRF